MQIINFLKLLYYKLSGKKIIIVNAASGLGDYLYSRAYLKLLREQYKDYKIILLGTHRWKSFAICNDSNFVDCFYFLKFCKNEHYELSFFNYDMHLQICPWNAVNSLIKAKIQYAPEYPTGYSTYSERIFRLFKNLINIPNDFKYEFGYTKAKKTLPQNYVLIAMSGFTHGTFTKKQLLKMIDYIVNKSEYFVLLIGFKNDNNLFKEVYQDLSTKAKNRVINGCNVFKTEEITSLVKNCKFAICPNTSIHHFCYLLEKNCICASSNEITTIYINSPNIKYIFNKELQIMIDENRVNEYIPNENAEKISEFEIKDFIRHIDNFIK